MRQKLLAIGLVWMSVICMTQVQGFAQIANIYEETVEGLYNIENNVQSEIATFSGVPSLYKAHLTVGNTTSGIYMYTEMIVSDPVPTIGVKDRLLQEKVFFGYTNRELAPDYSISNAHSLYKSHVFTYREVGKQYRVKCTQYYIYGGNTYEFYNETPYFTYAIQ